jgi:hypothetical protein
LLLTPRIRQKVLNSQSLLSSGFGARVNNGAWKQKLALIRKVTAKGERLGLKIIEFQFTNETVRRNLAKLLIG